MRLARRWPPTLPAEQRTSKAIAVTPEVWRYINTQRRGGESADDVLRRNLDLPKR